MAIAIVVLIVMLGVAVAALRLWSVGRGDTHSQSTSSSADGRSHLATLRPGSTLPSGSQCAARVMSVAIPEDRSVNVPYNKVTGQSVGNLFPAADAPQTNRVLAARIDGHFTGTTAQILRWAACKWGIDEDLVFAQAAVESWWRQTNLGDWGTDARACPPGHGIGQDGRAGLCPESYGILQNRYSVERSAWPALEQSTAMNVDVAYGIWRACFEGYEVWLNTVQRVGTYAPGDAWGCIGRWFAGRWHTAPAETYVAKVKQYLDQRVWLLGTFQES